MDVLFVTLPLFYVNIHNELLRDTHYRLTILFLIVANI